METPEGKLIKVVLEFENVTKTLEGDAAEDWMDKVNSNCTIAEIHGMNAMYGFNFDQFIVKSKEMICYDCHKVITSNDNHNNFYHESCWRKRPHGERES